MKTTRLIMCGLVAFVVCGGVAVAASGPPDWSLSGSLDGAPHDFRDKGYGIPAGGEVCKPCHTPHHAPYYDAGPIWNHALADASITNVEGGPLTGSSRLCMGCHDGVTAVDAYGYVDTTSFDKKTTGSEIIKVPRSILGTNMHDDHPVSVEYGAGGGIYELAATVADYLEDGKVECGSCHRAHGTGSDTLLVDGQKRYILRVTRANSAICRVCHTF